MAKAYIQWFDDDDLTIEFSEIPHVCIRYILPSATEQLNASIKKYPFINKRTLGVRLYDKEKEEIYDFVIPKGYCYDGATINRFFWRLIGSKTDNTFLIGALIHDWMCEQKDCVNNDRNFSSRVFRALLTTGGVGEFKAQVMYLAVDNFQKFCSWD